MIIFIGLLNCLCIGLFDKLNIEEGLIIWIYI